MAVLVPNRRKFGVEECFIECPYCHSKKTGANDYGKAWLILGAWFCLFIITIPFGVVALLMGIIAKAFQKSIKIKCDDCGRTFTVPRKEYSAHMQKIKHPQKVHLES